jgi:hypothetical protein
MNLVNSLAIAVIAFPATVADTMMAYTLSSKLTSNQTFASIDLHTTIHRPVMQGDDEPGLKGWEGTHMYLLIYIKMVKKWQVSFHLS